MWRAWDASTVISCMGLRCTVDATPTPVCAVMAELGAWAETGYWRMVDTELVMGV